MESLHVQTKFVPLVGYTFERFEKKNDFLWNFRCPYCGDSKKSKRKARAYFYRHAKTGLISFQCHNCGKAASFKTVLRDFAPNLYNEYILETFGAKNTRGEKGVSKDDDGVLPEKVWARNLTPISSLSKIHSAKKYIKSRKIPQSAYDRIWYSDDFGSFVKNLGLDKNLPEGDPRIVLTEEDRSGNLQIIVARTLLANNKLRYITLKINDSYPKLFGYSRIDHTKDVFVVEGAIDSFFLSNCVATLDSNLTKAAEHIHDPILIWDNEPRNREIVKLMKRGIEAGYRVVIFPSDIKGKDINEMILDGVDVESIIRSNIYKGIEAMLKFKLWRRA